MLSRPSSWGRRRTEKEWKEGDKREGGRKRKGGMGEERKRVERGEEKGKRGKFRSSFQKSMPQTGQGPRGGKTQKTDLTPWKIDRSSELHASERVAGL